MVAAQGTPLLASLPFGWVCLEWAGLCELVGGIGPERQRTRVWRSAKDGHVVVAAGRNMN